MDTISSESYAFSNLITDLDNFRSRYLETDINTGKSVIYPSSEIYAYEQNLFRLISDSTQVEFQTRWYMRPDYTSYDKYNTVTFWPLILFVNNIYSIEDYYGMDTVLIPPVDSIYDIIGTRVPKSEVTHINPFIYTPGISMFQRRPLDEIEQKRLQSLNNLETSTILEEEVPIDVSTKANTYTEQVDEFIMDSDILGLKYVDLRNVPINTSTVSLFVGNFKIPQKYGYDYVIKKDINLQEKRVSWNSSDCYNGRSNLGNLIQSGTHIKIKYLM